MKTRTKAIVAIIVLLMVIVATVFISRPFIIKYELKQAAKAEEEKAEVIKDGSVEKVVVDPIDYDALRIEVEEEMRKEFEASHQDPKKNEEYDKQVNEYVDFDIDPLPTAFENILKRTEKIVSMEYTLIDNRVDGGYTLYGILSYHYPYLDNPPFLQFSIKDIKHNAKTRLKYDAMAYVGFDSFAISSGYEPFKWLRVGAIITGQKIYLDGSEKILITPFIGCGIKF